MGRFERPHRLGQVITPEVLPPIQTPDVTGTVPRKLPLDIQTVPPAPGGTAADLQQAGQVFLGPPTAAPTLPPWAWLVIGYLALKWLKMI